LGLEESERPELDHDTKGTPGMADIAAEILSKIAQSAVFVADVTPVGTTIAGKALPNPNVMIELGYALQKPGWRQMIGVLNIAEGWKQADLPFDLRNRRVMSYFLKADANAVEKRNAKSKLVADLSEAIKTNLSHHVEIQTQDRKIEGTSSRLNDPSVWGTASAVIEHGDGLDGSKISKVNFLLGGPRAYVRLIPSGWTSVKPTIREIASAPDGLTVNAPIDGGVQHGNFGACSEGFVRYWVTAGNADYNFETSNVTMYLDEVGEFWSVHGTVLGESKGTICLRNEAMLKSWFHFLKTANAALDYFGAEKTRRVEMGLSGMHNVRWFSHWADGSVSRKPAFNYSFQARDWSDQDIREKLVAAYSGVKNIFALPRATLEEINSIIPKTA
jgi:hypothetical protein